MRTIDDIKNEIKGNYINNTDVRAKYGITGNVSFDETFSSASIEAIFITVIAYIVYGLEFLLARHMEEVEAREDQMRVGTLNWWKEIIKAFQYGDDLVYDENTNTYQYVDDNPDAQIIKYAEVRESESGLLILINQADGNNNPEMIPDPSPIRDAFQSYLNKIKIAGIQVIWGSYNPDKIMLNLNVKYDPLVMNASGELINTGEKPVNSALKAYLNTLTYGSGTINKTKIIDAIQLTEGVVDVWADTLDWLFVSNDNNPSYTAVQNQELLSYGGSFKFESDDDIIINYVANV
jgi:hypothetical protein